MKKLFVLAVCAMIAIGAAANDIDTVKVNWMSNITFEGGNILLDVKENTNKNDVYILINTDEKTRKGIEVSEDDMGDITLKAPKGGDTIKVSILRGWTFYGIKATEGSVLNCRFGEDTKMGQMSFIADKGSVINCEDMVDANTFRAKAFDDSEIRFATKGEYVFAEAYDGAKVEFESYTKFVNAVAENKSQITGKGKTTTIIAKANEKSSCDFKHLDAIDCITEFNDLSHINLGCRGDILMSGGSTSYVAHYNMELGVGSGQWGPSKKKIDSRDNFDIGGKWKEESFLRKSQAYEVYELKGKPHTVQQVTYQAVDTLGEIRKGKIVPYFGFGSMGNVRFIVFDKHGNATMRSATYADEIMNVTNRLPQYKLYTYKYNRHGDIIEYKEYIHTDSTTVKTVRYENEYNEYNRIIKQTEWLHNGNLRGYTKTYNNQMQVEEMSWTPNATPDSSAEVNFDLTYAYKYDNRGNKLEKSTVDKKEPVLNQTATYKYSEPTHWNSGRLIEINNSYGSKIFISYDNANNTRTETFINKEGVMSEVSVFKLDIYGNWTERTTTYMKNGKVDKILVTVQEISYY